MSLFRRRTDEDLFRETTMSFGEHLEELRVCLFRAVFGLALGTLIGLAIGHYVVAAIRAPLESALQRYYKNRALVFAEDARDRLEAHGYRFAQSAEELAEFIEKNELILEEVFVNPVELAKSLNEKVIEVPSTGSAMGGLTSIFLWRRAADDPWSRVKTQNVQEALMVWMKASLVVGFILASPWIFYQMWTFVAAGLYKHERRYVHIFLPFSIGLFLAGVVLASFVFKPVLDFLFRVNAWSGTDPVPRINEWLSFVLFMPLGFGISFQLPLVMLFLERIGIITIGNYLSYWRVAVLVIFVAAMLLTPSGDPYSMMMMAGPLTVLYFGGILLCKVMPRLGVRPEDFGA